MSSQKQYARVQNNTVVEFPLFLHQIINRGHTESMYHEVVSSTKPDIRENETLVNSYDIYDNKVFLKWSVVLLKPEQYYKRIVKSMNTPLDSIVPTVMPATVTANMDKLQYMRPLLIECVDAMIDVLCVEYAVKMGYKNADRLASYATDPNPQWKADADAFVSIRSNAYSFAFGAFSIEALVTDGKIPTSIKPSMDIISNLFKGV